MRLPTSPLVLPRLPYELNALEPIISTEAMAVHYHGHHQTYIDNFNKLLVEGGKIEDMEFNYSGHLLHSLLWKNLAPFPTNLNKEMQKLVLLHFPSINHFLDKITKDITSIKGSGWLILTSQFELETIPNHDIARIKGKHPLLVLDAWEHFYYIDYNNKKTDFFKNLIRIIDWDTVITRHYKNISS